MLHKMILCDSLDEAAFGTASWMEVLIQPFVRLQRGQFLQMFLNVNKVQQAKKWFKKQDG